MDNHSLMLIAAFITQIKANGVAAFLINRMQVSKHPLLTWISAHTPWATRLVSFVFAGGTAIGVHATYNVAKGGVIAIPPAAVMIAATWQLAQNYAVQHAWGRVIAERVIPAIENVPAILGTMAGGQVPGAPPPGGAPKP